MLVLLLCQVLAIPMDESWQTEAAAQVSAVSQKTENRPYHEISRDMRSLLRREAAANQEHEHRAAIVGLTNLYAEIMLDERLGDSDTLQSYRVKIRSRLLRAQQDIERVIARRTEDSKQPLRDPSDDLAVIIASQVSIQLTMLVPAGGRDGLSTFGSGSYGWFGGAPRRDYGPDLVALIQRTISPKSWDVNGGAGTIYYYWPWYALVVRNTGEVHRQIGGLRDGL
jgi:hypothetical protein